MKPFIYLSSLRRTGSKMLSEALSLYPYSYIFREPKIGCGRFKIKPVDVEIFDKYGVDLPRHREKILGADPEAAVRCFRKELLPELLRVFSQIGIKEIHHKYWRNVYKEFPDMKIIMTGRDPRDIYISLYYRQKELKTKDWERRLGGPFTPQTVVRNLQNDFNYQIEMYHTVSCVKVRYEDFCADLNLLKLIKDFVDSDIPEIGIVGQLSEQNYLIHGNRITDKRVHRWKRETDKRLLFEAQEVFDRFEEYTQFWEYER